MGAIPPGAYASRFAGGGGDVLTGQVADGAQEHGDGPAVRRSHRLGQRGVVDRVVGQADHTAHYKDFRQPPLTGGMTATSSPGFRICESSAKSWLTASA